uniref:Tail assembly chaperone n=1 Tax=Gordonia phage Petito TaxID=3158876 RepID=A0AAU8GPZ5_9CAUD
MLKQSVSYTDFDDNECVETLYFNLTKTELTDNLNLKDELEKIQQDFTGQPKRNLEEHEIRRILDLVKTFMRLSYGIRSEDGKRFIKTPEIWTEFTQTAAYDSFLFGLFENPSNALAFMTGILPKDLRSKALAEATKQNGGVDPIRQAEVMAAQAEQAKRAEEMSKPQNVVELPSVDPETGEKPVLGPNPTKEELDAYLEWMNKQ